MNDLLKDFKIQPTKLRGENMEEIQKIINKLSNRKQETLLQGLRECQLKNIEHVFITREEYIDKILNYINDLQQELTNLKAIEKEHQRMNGELREEVKELKKQLEIGKQQYKDLVEEKENLQENLSSITLQLENTEKGLINEYNDMLDKRNKLFVENCKLKEKLENNSKINVSDHKYASKKEDEVITYKHIIDELEEWLNDLGNWVVLEKLQELKGESNE